MHKPNKLKLTDLNPHLTCALCGGYYIDATTIVECLHSFCKACIVRYLQTHKYCPVCDVQVHKTKPLENIRSDQMLQDIVYKVVPRLFQNEMKCRREFYSKHPVAKPANNEDAGEAASHICSPDEPINLSLEYFNSNSKYGQKRYFRCPAAVTVSHLQKLIRAKFELSPLQQVDIMYMGNPLESELSLMDITYIYAWKRKGSLELSYCIFDEPNKRIKLDLSSLQTVKTDDNIYLKETEVKTIASDMPMHYKSDGNDNVILESDKENESEKIHSKDSTIQKKQDEWKEIQLEIRENGIMLVRDVQKDDISPAKGNNQKMSSSQNEMEINLTRTSTLANKNRTQLEKSCAENFVTKTLSQDNTSAKEMSQNVSENNSLESNGHKNSNENETSNEQDKQITIENDKQMCKSLKILEDNNVSVTASTSPLQTIKYRIIPSHIVPVTQGKKRFCLEKNYSEPDSSVTEPYSTEAKKQNSLPLMMKVSPIIKPELYKCMSKHKKSPCNNECYKLVSPREYHDNSSCVKKDSLKMAIVAPTQLNKTQSNTCSFNYEPLNIPYRNWNPSISQLRFNSPKPVSSSSNSNVSSSSNSNISSSSNSSVSSSSNSDVSSSSFSNAKKGTNPSLNTAGTILHANSTYAMKNETNHNPKAKPPQLSKMRNVPRYLGNPASGVKPMYQVAPYDSVDSSKSKNVVAKQTSISVTKNNSTISNPVKSLSSNITSPPAASFTALSSSKFSSTVQSRNVYTATTTVPSFSGYLNSLTVNKATCNASPTMSSASVLQNSKTTHNSRNVSHHHSLVSSSTDTSYRSSSNFPITSPNATSDHDPLNVQNRLSYMPPPASFHLFSSASNMVLNHLKAHTTSEKSKQALNSGLPAVQRIPPSNTQSRSNKLTGNTVIPPFVSQSINKTSISAVNKYNYIYSSPTSSTTVHSSNTAVSNVISSNSKGNEGVAKGELQKSKNSKEPVSQTFEPRTSDTRMSHESSAETSSNEKTLTEPEDNKPEPQQVELPNNTNS